MNVISKKTSLKKVLVAALVAVIGLSGCVTETILDDMNSGAGSEIIKSDLKNVTLKVASQSPATRSEGASVAMRETVLFNSGWLLFVSAQNNVTKVMEITKTSTNTLNDSQVDISLLTQTDGVDIQDVPGYSQSVYVIGNLSSGGGITTPAVGVSMAALKQNLIDFSSQGDINNVTLFGGDLIKAENSKHVARFSLAPIVARIEIAKISSTNSSDITSFKIDGIFINNYYGQITLDGSAPSVAIKNAQTSAFVEGSAAYPIMHKGILFDYKSAPGQSLGTASAADAYVPQTGEAWVYNLLAPQTTTQPALSAPHIVIAISDIQTNNGVDYNGTWYMTITNLVYNKSKITHLEPGKVYSIQHINFSHTNIQPEPEMKTMAVDVEVSLVEWDILDTDVIFGQD